MPSDRLTCCSILYPIGKVTPRVRCGHMIILIVNPPLVGASITCHAIAERMRNGLLRRRTGLERLAASLEALSPLKVLARGYSVTRTAAGRLVTRPPQVASGEEIRTTLEGGEIRSRVV